MLNGHSNIVDSVVFSHNSTRLALASQDETVKIWDLSSGKCLQTRGVGKALLNKSFEMTDSYLRTEIGIVAIDMYIISCQHEIEYNGSSESSISWRGSKFRRSTDNIQFGEFSVATVRVPACLFGRAGEDHRHRRWI
jgi:WD40 repeat protein